MYQYAQGAKKGLTAKKEKKNFFKWMDLLNWSRNRMFFFRLQLLLKRVVPAPQPYYIIKKVFAQKNDARQILYDNLSAFLLLSPLLHLQLGRFLLLDRAL